MSAFPWELRSGFLFVTVFPGQWSDPSRVSPGPQEGVHLHELC